MSTKKTFSGNWLFVRLAAVCIATTACNRAPEAEPSAGVASTSATSAVVGNPADQALNISFKTKPDPAKAGDNTIEVVVKNADGTPLTDATVSAIFYMPAMPSMNMPEMRSTFPLTTQGEGRYEGKGELVMSGTWDVTVSVLRGQEKLGSKKLTIIAK